jgi:hypothetical protein
MESFCPGHLWFITTQLYAKHKSHYPSKVGEGFIPDAVLGAGNGL